MSDTGVSGGKTLLAKQASEIIESETTALDLVSKLDVDIYRHDDRHKDTPSKPFVPTFRAILAKRLEDWGDRELRERLTSDDSIAAELGFNPDDIPDRSTFYRADKHRFEELDTVLKTSVRQIETIAAERGSPIGANLVPEDSEGSSERTLRRLLRRKTREVIDEMRDVVFPALNIPRPDEPIYEEDELLMVETLTSLLHSAANDGADIFSDKCDPEAKLSEEDPFHLDGPTGETLLTAIKELVPVLITKMVNRAALRCLSRAKPYIEFERPVKIACDHTYVGFYGELEGMERLTKAPDDKKYEDCHEFATASIVGDNVSFLVAMYPVGDPDHHEPDAYPGKDRSYRQGHIMRELLDQATEAVSVRKLVADRAFYAADVFAACEEHNIKYTIPVPEGERAASVVEKAGDQVYVRENYGVSGPVKGGVTNTRVETNIVVLPPDDDYDSKQPFATNSEVSDEISLDRRETRRKIKRYTDRGGIETSYEKIKDFAAWTTSREYVVRLFHFGFATLLYNMWLLVDLMVQSAIDLEFRAKPRITADRFRKAFEREINRILRG
ncbi:transposase [Halorussus sp. AFM4]|uniref:transposase n=1 Tax=Halorussus sp. AFM4 TaxID=3421651 RepID=UPI003EBDD7BF